VQAKEAKEGGEYAEQEYEKYRCVAVSCSVVQRIAAWRSLVQYGVVLCSVVLCLAVGAVCCGAGE